MKSWLQSRALFFILQLKGYKILSVEDVGVMLVDSKDRIKTIITKAKCYIYLQIYHLQTAHYLYNTI